MPKRAVKAAKAVEKPDLKLVGALSSGLDILRYMVRASGPVGVNQVARDLDLNPSTTFNLLKTLTHERLLVFDADAKTYKLGLGFVEMAHGVLEEAGLARAVRPHLEAIVAQFEVTATLWQRSGNRMVLIDRADNAHAIRVHMSIGQRLPLFIAALGRAMAAHEGLTKDELRKAFSMLRWQDPPSFETYYKEVEAARILGYALDVDHYVSGVTAVSSAILGKDGRGMMAFSVVGFSRQFSSSRISELGVEIRNRAREVTLALTGVNAGLKAS